jgi:AraC-like DNA-binding protein
MRAAVLESIVPDFNSSFRVLTMDNAGPHCLNYWHYHPEYELVYINRGCATRHIGTSIDKFVDGDLILVGSHLPHRSFTEDLMEPHKEVIVQWHPYFLGEDFFECPELSRIRQLLRLSQNGLSFHGTTKKKVGNLLLELDNSEAFESVNALLNILHLLSISKEYTNLNAAGFELIHRPHDQERIETIFDYVKENYQSDIDLRQIAAKTNMTKQSFCRYFKQCTALTFFEFVTRYRIGQATQQLAHISQSVAAVSFNCGFNNLSTFNKQFKKTTGLTPLAYRKAFAGIGHSELSR